MRPHRQGRMAEEIRKRLSEVVASEIKDPRLGFLTITNVELSNDLQHATVYVSVLGDEATQQETLRILERVKGFLRHEVGTALQVRNTPELVFKLDHSIEEGTRILQIMRELERERSS
jgi:ribosome-binding factor A